VRQAGLSVVIPVFDERGNLELLWSELRAEMESTRRRFEVIFVDDGSEDGSGQLLERFAREDPRVTVLRLDGNRGQTAALDAGFRAAREELIITLDGDGQNDPSDIPMLLPRMDCLDLIVGVRRDRSDSWTRRASARIANSIRNWVLDERILDTGCGLKIFRRACLSRIRLYDGMHRFLPTLFRLEGFRVGEAPVRHRMRRWGRSKYRLLSRLRRTVPDLLAVRWMKARRLDYRAEDSRPLTERVRNNRVGSPL